MPPPTPLHDTDLTVEDWLHQWLGTRLGLRPSTLANYRCHIDKHLVPQLGDLPLRQLSPVHVQQAHFRLLNAGMSHATLVRVHATLSSALATASRQGLLDGDPLAGVQLPKPMPYTSTMWSAEQAQTFLTASAHHPLHPLFRLALVTGMRRGELLGLQWADIDSSQGMVHVRRSRTMAGSQSVVGPPKSAAGRRVLHVDALTLRLLGTPGAPEAWVFLDGEEQPLSPWHVTRAFTALMARLALPRVRFHDLRHISATLGLQAGESLKAVSNRLGHSTIGVTAQIYLAVPDAVARENSRALVSLLQASDRKAA